MSVTHHDARAAPWLDEQRLTTWIATTRTRYAIGIAANRPSAALHGVRVGAGPGAARERDDEPRDDRAGEEHAEDEQRAGEDPQLRLPSGGTALRARATS